DPRRLDPAAEDVGERVDHLAERAIRARAVDERGHQVDLGVGGFGADARERAGDRVVVAFAPHLFEPAALLLLDLRTDAQRRRRRFVVAFEEAVHADDDVPARVQLALELVRGVGDLALVPALLDAPDRTLEHGATALLADPREELLG